MKAELTKGKMYTVEISDIFLKGKYMGEHNGMHIFENTFDGRKSYIILEDKWAVFKTEGDADSGYVTHVETSSCPIVVIPRISIDDVRNRRVKSGLLKIAYGENQNG